MGLLITLSPLVIGIVLIALLAHFGPKLSRRPPQPSSLAAGSSAIRVPEAAERDDPGPPPGPAYPSP